jgi:hypothetical protein
MMKKFVNSFATRLLLLIIKEKKIKSDRDLMDSHEKKIIKELKFTHKPIVLYGDEALSFIRINVPAFQKSSDKKIKNRVNGYFHYENLPPKYVNTGVVCIFKEKISTLAHELCHAKQFQDDNKWLWLVSRNWRMKLLYKLGYFFYPAEREAFKYALAYLEENEFYELANSYKRHILKVIVKTIIRLLCTTILLYSVVYLIYLFFDLYLITNNIKPMNMLRESKNL